MDTETQLKCIAVLREYNIMQEVRENYKCCPFKNASYLAVSVLHSFDFPEQACSKIKIKVLIYIPVISQ